MTSRLIILIIFASLISACTYGPVQESVRITNVAARFNTYTAAVAIDYQRFREPTGLSKFPDGCSPRILERATLVYFCDIQNASTKLLAKIEMPSDIQYGFQPWIIGWAEGNVYVRLNGYPGTDLRDYQQGPKSHIFQVALNGKYQKVEQSPSVLEQKPNNGIPVEGETRFMRISHDAFDIKIRTEEGGTFRKKFQIDQTKCTLEPTL